MQNSAQASGVAEVKREPTPEARNQPKLEEEPSLEIYREHRVKKECTTPRKSTASGFLSVQRDEAPETPSKKKSRHSLPSEASSPYRSVERQCSQCRFRGHDIRNCPFNDGGRGGRQRRSPEPMVTMSTTTTVGGLGADTTDVAAMTAFDQRPTGTITTSQRMTLTTVVGGRVAKATPRKKAPARK